MLKTGRAHLEALRDGRTVYVGGERVADVTTHPSFRRAAQSVAGLYDLKLAPAQRDTLTYEEEGGCHSIYFLRPRTRDDLQRRMVGHRQPGIDRLMCRLGLDGRARALSFRQGRQA